ncbi:MAG: PmoA family protein [Planctomycetaceae bacterium]|nr:PmoA family protein [Planctomycetaceae bacterium]
MRNTVFGFCLVVISCPITTAWSETTVTVLATERSLRPQPVEVVVPESYRTAHLLQLVTPQGNIPVQWEDAALGRAVFLLPQTLASGESWSATLQTLPKVDRPFREQGWVRARMNKREEFLSLSVAYRTALRYAVQPRVPPEGIDPLYTRSGHIHPLLTPGQTLLTSEFPADHAHQHGVFHAWVNTEFAGRKVDFWNQHRRTGNVEHVRIVSQTAGEVFGEFTVELQHVALDDAGAKTPVLSELLTVRAWHLTDRYVIDLTTRQTCIADAPLKILDYHYGGMAIRGRDEWLNNPAADFLTSEGKTRLDGNHSRPNWVAMHGPVNDGAAHVAIMGHPTNFRHPQPVRLHPSKPYFVFSPPVLGEFSIPPKETYTGRYRYLTADSNPVPDLLDDDYVNYTQPLAAVVE